jgi:hypothetical protein
LWRSRSDGLATGNHTISLQINQKIKEQIINDFPLGFVDIEGAEREQKGKLKPDIHMALIAIHRCIFSLSLNLTQDFRPPPEELEQVDDPETSRIIPATESK